MTEVSDEMIRAFCLGALMGDPTEPSPDPRLEQVRENTRKRARDGIAAVLALLDQSKPDQEKSGGWSYSINYGPDGQEDWANLTTPEGHHVSNIPTHHAIRIVAGLNGSPQPRA